MRMVSSDPAQDAALERDFFESNAAAYADLRDRGLLPARGENVELQDINEYLLQGNAHHGRSNIGAATPAGPVNDAVLGGGWDDVLRDELEKPYWSKLQECIAYERETGEVYPPPAQTFKAFQLTPYEDVKVVILGQDPYIGPGQAHGLAFSVPAGVAIPPSLYATSAKNWQPTSRSA